MKAAASAACVFLLGSSCSKPAAMQNARRDIHSFSNPEEIRVRNLELDCDVLFDRKILKGTATLSLDRRIAAGEAPLILDTRKLSIEKVEAAPENGTFSDAEF